MTTRLLTVCGSLQQRSANRAVLAVVLEHARASGATVDDFDGLAAIPPFNPDRGDAPGVAVDDWRARIGAADAVVIASPEYAGSLAGVVKNALDWVVGSGELYRRPVGLVSAGTSGGIEARAALVRTLTWQGAHVVASLGIEAPRTRTDATGAIDEPATLAALESFTAAVLAVVAASPAARAAAARTVVVAAGVDPGRIAPVP